MTISNGHADPAAASTTVVPAATPTPPATALAAVLFYTTDPAAGFGNATAFPSPPGTKASYKSMKHRDSHGVRWGATNDPAVIRADFKRWPLANVGLPTGSKTGFFVVEADTMKGHGKDGIAALAALQAKHGAFPPTRTARSPSGSLHYYFLVPSGIEIKGGSDKLAPGVDVCGDGQMVIAPPSTRHDGQYTWQNWVPIAEAPEWLIALCKKQPRSKPTYAGNGSGQPHIDFMEVEAALYLIPNTAQGWEVLKREKDWEGYDAWCNIGLALWGAFDGHEDGLKAFLTWSAKCEAKYNEDDTYEKWDAYDGCPPTDIGVGTLYWLAKFIDPDWRSIFDGWLVNFINSVAVGKDTPSFGEHWEKRKREREQAKAKAAQKPEPEAEPPPDPEPQPDLKPGPAPDQKPKSGKLPLMISNADFIAGFEPPDYLIDGLLQRRYLYALTAMTNAGKTTVALLLTALVALGRPLGGRAIEQGKVLFFAGENPDDIRMRWIKLCEELGIADTDQVFWAPGSFAISQLRREIIAQTKEHGPFALVIIDTAAAYFDGDDENSNTQFGNYARNTLRPLVEVSGGPTVLVLCHPIKNANPDNLLPRGGGAFVNEIDGNLVLMPKSELPKVVEMHWHGKFRGPDFAPIPFMLKVGTSERINDSKGRLLWTVTAKVLTAAEAVASEDVGRKRQDELLAALQRQDGRSLTALAQALGWFYASGEPNKAAVDRAMKDLEGRRLVKKEAGHWRLTKAGRAATVEDDGLM